MNWMVATVADSIKAIFVRVGEALPNLLGAIVILVLGWMIARVVQQWVVKGLKLIRLDDLSEKLQISQMLSRGEVRYSLSELLGVFLYWLLVLAFALAALDVLDLKMAAGLLDKVLSYVPDVVAGVIVLVLGLFLASVVSGSVQTAAANMGIGQARALGQIARVVVIIFAVAVALEKFFSSIIIQTTFTIVVAAVAFGAALAFGLGCKDIAGRAVGDFLDKLRGGR